MVDIHCLVPYTPWTKPSTERSTSRSGQWRPVPCPSSFTCANWLRLASCKPWSFLRGKLCVVPSVNKQLERVGLWIVPGFSCFDPRVFRLLYRVADLLFRRLDGICPIDCQPCSRTLSTQLYGITFVGSNLVPVRVFNGNDEAVVIFSSESKHLFDF